MQNLDGIFISINHSVEIARLFHRTSKTLRAHARANIQPNTCVRCGKSVFHKCVHESSTGLACWRVALHEKCWRTLGALPVLTDVLGNAHTMWHPQVHIAERSVTLLKRAAPQILLMRALGNALFVMMLLLVCPVKRERSFSLRHIQEFYACHKTAALRRLRT